MQSLSPKQLRTYMDSQHIVLCKDKLALGNQCMADLTNALQHKCDCSMYAACARTQRLQWAGPVCQRNTG